MAVSISGGIERVSYQFTEVASRGDFPMSKANLTAVATIPSRTNEVFGLNSSARLMESAIRPPSTNREIVTPSKFMSLCLDVQAAVDNHPAEGAKARKVLAASQSLLAEMRSNAELFNGARNERVPG